MPTPFYSHRFVRLFPVTLLLLERLDALASKNGGAVTVEMAEATLSELVPGLGSAEDMEVAIDYLTQRLSTQPGTDKPAPSPKRNVRTFGAALADFYRSLEPWEEMVAAWGWAEARRMYCEEDRDDVFAALGVWHKQMEGRHSMALESAAYGFGGKYSEDKGSEATVIDMSDGAKALAAMQEAIDAINKGAH